MAGCISDLVQAAVLRRKAFQTQEASAGGGHTPVDGILRKRNLISCDVFSKDSSGEPSGTQEFPVIDTVTWEYCGVL